MSRQNWQPYLCALGSVMVCTGVAWVLHTQLPEANLIMIYLLGVVWVAARGPGPAILASIISVAVFDFLFVKPYFSFAVFDSEYFISLAVMLTVAFMISTLTDRIKQQSEQSLLLSKQAQAEKLRSSLLSSVSHDLRTPLATITGAASGIIEAKAVPADRAIELAQVIYEEGERMERLITNLLSMTKLQTGQINLKREWLPVEEVVGSALAAMEKRLNGRCLTTDLDQQLPLVLLDPIMLEQVFINLLDNAVKHTETQAAIEISAKSTAKQVTIAVTDTGAGISAQDADRIFEDFYQANSGKSRYGSGMGLTICRGIISAHGGKIWVEPNTPHGCKFMFTIPLAATPPVIPGLPLSGAS